MCGNDKRRRRRPGLCCCSSTRRSILLLLIGAEIARGACGGGGGDLSSSESGLFDDGDVDEEYFNDEDCYFNDEDDGSGGCGGRPDPRRKRRVRGGRPSLAISARYDEAPRSRRLPGLIYVDVRVGSPPSSSVRQTLVVSTSSDYAVFPCDYDDEEEEYDEYNDNGEDGDAQRPRRFDGRYSDTFRPVGCESCFLEEPGGGGLGQRRRRTAAMAVTSIRIGALYREPYWERRTLGRPTR